MLMTDTLYKLNAHIETKVRIQHYTYMFSEGKGHGKYEQVSHFKAIIYDFDLH